MGGWNKSRRIRWTEYVAHTREIRTNTQFLTGNMKRRDKMGDIGICRGTLLKLILKK
jgi:hypothetical protein